MPKPLQTDDDQRLNRPAFKDFGVLNAGNQGKGSLLFSITVNILLALVIVIIGAATKKTIETKMRVTELVAPVPIPPEPKPIPPKIIPPKFPKVPPPVDPPKIHVAEVPLPEPPKVPIIKMNEPVPINKPAPPKLVTPPAAPKVVNLAHPEAASVVNNSPRPTAVALGNPNNPIAVSNRPATAAVNLGNAGMPGMNAKNTGAGPRSAVVNLGNGSAGSQNTAGNGVRAVQGVPLGRPGGTGELNSTGRNAAVAGVNLGNPPQIASAKVPTLAQGPVRTGPKVVFKPRPDYTAEARAQHIEGTVTVSLRVSATGAVTVLGVTNGLGHGLDESARRAVEATRFQPATDSSGHPVDWEGRVNVVFQLAG
ncbi:TonB family C-terminal domain-containing protein [Granulicella pectinivorans]|uniref:TonB family C-terminal domain-containing protein n=1 Tax=Granulicella pectinivorans TaxID=474950 RepID=A0A1I6MSV4_9BACT|nr:energy transducer TonB [Granulicella pectinivorans]SFS18786.1 TonB family C-terminal domain-containing protein [Granulicella pectinivorans]